jgi:hypothetical protein
VKITTSPAGRFGWEGQTIEYTVKVEGASEVAAPAKTADGLKVRILDQHQAGSGVEARVAVDVAKPVFV